jgi:predicted DNA-binding transcriptional regulator YafY
MTEQAKIYRVLSLIAQLRNPIGCSKKQFSNDFEISERTFERYINLLEDLGFQIEKTQQRFRIVQLSKNNLKHEDFIVFSLEEAGLIKDAVLNHAEINPIKQNILNKLYTLTDLNEITDSIKEQVFSKNVSEIRNAIKEKKQICLKNYVSLNSNTEKDRIIEPIRWIKYYQYLMAFDLEDKTVKQFKTDRIVGVKTSNINWKFEHLHLKFETDIFGMSGEEKIKVKLKLSKRAKQLLEEEYMVFSNTIEQQKNFYIFEDHVYSFAGIGRFVMGLANEIEIIEPKELRLYILEKFKKQLIKID